MLFVVRTLESLLYPVGFIWLCLTVAAIVFWRKKARNAAGFCLFLSAFLYLAGATPIAEFLIARLERPFASATVTNAQSADVVIVLGGNLNASAHDTFEVSLNSSADRIIAGIELVREKRAAAMIIGGGADTIAQKDVSEGKRVESWLKKWEVTVEIIGLSACANTHEEALHSREVMAAHRWTNAILVTSAFHMRRALAAFQKEGIAVRPVACDFEGLPVTEGEMQGWQIVPVIEHLKTLTQYVHEVIGWFYYSIRGWI